jgi:hypothetical protein
MIPERARTINLWDGILFRPLTGEYLATLSHHRPKYVGHAPSLAEAVRMRDAAHKDARLVEDADLGSVPGRASTTCAPRTRHSKESEIDEKTHTETRTHRQTA